MGREIAGPLFFLMILIPIIFAIISWKEDSRLNRDAAKAADVNGSPIAKGCVR